MSYPCPDFNPQSQKGDRPPDNDDFGQIPATRTTPNEPKNRPRPSVPLDQLEPQPQWINCPNCNQRARTAVRGRSRGGMIMMDLLFWPIPGRRHWWETTRWSCENCDKELASQRNGKELRVLVERE